MNSQGFLAVGRMKEAITRMNWADNADCAITIKSQNLAVNVVLPSEEAAVIVPL